MVDLPFILPKHNVAAIIQTTMSSQMSRTRTRLYVRSNARSATATCRLTILASLSIGNAGPDVHRCDLIPRWPSGLSWSFGTASNCHQTRRFAFYSFRRGAYPLKHSANYATEAQFGFACFDTPLTEKRKRNQVSLLMLQLCAWK